MLNVLLVFCSLIFCNCNILENQKAEQIQIENIINGWAHSVEEELDSVKIYRPFDFRELPPSRYRQKFIFKDNSECRFFVLAPTDAHNYHDGKWTYDDKSKNLFIYDLDDQIRFRYQILEISNNILKFLEIK